MAKITIILFIALCCVYGGAALVCRAETPLGGISFNCPRKYAPFNEKDEDVLCCGSKTDIGGQICCSPPQYIGNNAGLIIGIVASIVALLVITLCICCCCKCCCLYQRRNPGTVHAQAMVRRDLNRDPTTRNNRGHVNHTKKTVHVQALKV